MLGSSGPVRVSLCAVLVCVGSLWGAEAFASPGEVRPSEVLAASDAKLTGYGATLPGRGGDRRTIGPWRRTLPPPGATPRWKCSR